MKRHVFFAVAVSVISLAFAANVVLADIYSDSAKYRESNNDTSTLLINDFGWNTAAGGKSTDMSLYQMFNRYFKTEYASSDALYESRGVDNSSWISSSEMVVIPTFKTASFEHSLTISDSTGSVFNAVFAGDDSGTFYGTSGYEVTNAVNGEFSMQIDNSLGGTGYPSVFSNASLNEDGLIQFISMDVSDLIKDDARFADAIAELGIWDDTFRAIFVGVEDITISGYYRDYDYNDLGMIVVFKDSTSSKSATPEPATLLILGLALVGAPFSRKLRSLRK